MPAAPPILTVALYGWAAGAVPTVTASNDNWNRVMSFGASGSSNQAYANYGTPGQWTSQTFSWTPGIALSYISLAVIGNNQNHDQYIAWDITPVPEPSTGLLLALGLGGIAARRRTRRS
jgi:hypothetical protein